MPPKKKKKKARYIELYEAPASTTSVSSIGVEDKFREEHYISTLMTLPYDEIKGTKAEGDWHDIQGVLHGSVSKMPEDKRNIIQKTADKIYESGPIGSVAAGVADILPGIPFVDIIDPPSQLSDPQMQTSRNLLGALSFPLMMSQTPKAIGRVATNIREPVGYGGSLSSIKQNVMGGQGEIAYLAKEPSKVKRIGGAISRTIKSIVQDKPLYDDKVKKSMLWANVASPRHPKHISAVLDAREFLYRRTFGLKPRKGTKIFKENKDGTLSFNPKSKRAKILIAEIREGVSGKGGAFSLRENVYNPWHGVMGGYTAKVRFGTKPSKSGGRRRIDYEDIWDFKMHPNEWKDIFHPNIHLKGLKKFYPYRPQREQMAQAGLRTLVDVITTAPVIRGTVAF